MDIRHGITEFSLKHYKGVTASMIAAVVVLGAMIPMIRVDTDPENMLAHDEPVRLFHDATKKQFTLSDIVVVGVINEKDPDGVFNPTSLSNIYELTEFARTLRWPDKNDPSKTIGVIEVDLLAPSTVDYIGQGGPGTVRFEWLMSKAPTTRDEAREVRDKAMSNPLLVGTMVSEDGKALCLYVPITSKDLSYKVAGELKRKISSLQGSDQYHITGLPVAEDTFGVEMFVQMAVSAPAAMLTIFVLMFIFFRKLVLIVSPMVVAMATVIVTMGLMIGLGFPVHIMSSMIPIFLMPIAVVDSVHIISEFFERYTKEKGRRQTMIEVMSTLFVPMLYTSLTSAAGFLSLAITPIPPVQVFGVMVAVGVMVAWLLTVTFVPAYVMFIREEKLSDFGAALHHGEEKSWLAKAMDDAGRFTFSYARTILMVGLVICAVAIYGISKIQVNDNPVKWFGAKHPIRIADVELNKHFGGTYMAYLVLDARKVETIDSAFVSSLRQDMRSMSDRLGREHPRAAAAREELDRLIVDKAAAAGTRDKLLLLAGEHAMRMSESAGDPNVSDLWYEMESFFAARRQGLAVFKQPEVLEYVGRLQEYLAGIENGRLVGKSNSLTDIVRKVYKELTDGSEANYKIPDGPGKVAECLLQFQSSHTPDDLWHFVTSDYMHANVWLQLKSGDNKEMSKVVRAVETFFRDNPPPVPIDHQWAGLTYINVVWQDKMVKGMLMSFLGSFAVVFVMMVILFRSVLWGLVSMIPLTLTIGFIYGAIGLGGKEYDMPVAVLSSLTLGMAVDFAIHFLQRAKMLYAEKGSWKAIAPEMFGEPALAIARNVLVIAIGFLPLLLAPLVPYKTVGVLVCAIMAVSGIVTMFILPAIMRVAENQLFLPGKEPVGATCNCMLCIVVSVGSVLVVLLNAAMMLGINNFQMIWITLVSVPVAAAVCGIVSRRRACKMAGKAEPSKREPI